MKNSKKMKPKTIKFAFLIMLSLTMTCFLSCQKSESDEISLTAKEKTLNIESPSGKAIADNIIALKNETSEVISKKYGNVKEFEITEINYLPVKKGYAAIIWYHLDDGTLGNYGVLSGVKFTTESESVSTNIKTVKNLTSNQSQNKVAKEVTISCSGSCGCTVGGTVDPDGTVHWNCGCSDCVAHVTW